MTTHWASLTPVLETDCWMTTSCKVEHEWVTVCEVHMYVYMAERTKRLFSHGNSAEPKHESAVSEPVVVESCSRGFSLTDCSLSFGAIIFSLRQELCIWEMGVAERHRLVRFRLTWLINPTLHNQLGLNLKSAFSRIPKLVMVQIKTTLHEDQTVNSQSYMPLTEISSCHHKPFPQGGDTNKLGSWIGTFYIAGYVLDPGLTWVRVLV